MIIALALTSLTLYLAYRWSVATFDYFERRRVPFVKPVPLFGTMWPFVRGWMNTTDCVSEGYRLFRGSRFSGQFTFRKPGYLIHDLELVKEITVKDFDHFVDHSFTFSPELDPLMGRALIFTDGNRWKRGRSGLSPAFTGSKMRNMFELITNYSDRAMKRIWESANGGKIEREMRDLFQRLGHDVITSISFGADVDSIGEPDNELFQYCKRLTATNGIAGFKFFLATLLPEQLFIWLNVKLVPTDVAAFYESIVSNTIKNRVEKGLFRPDFIQLLMQARKNLLQQDRKDSELSNVGFSTVEEHLQTTNETPMKWTDLDITATAASFFFGGIETTATLLSFAVYEISLNSDIQDKLQQEIDSIQAGLGNNLLTYESVQSMKYLDMVVTETLRLWPPLGVLDRKCTRNFVMQDNNGTQVTVEKGTVLQIPVQSIHRDPQYYPDPMKFDPERFSEENRHTINKNAFLPFGAGPRNCIGSRLALMQSKCFLYYLLRYFRVEISSKTDVPIQVDKRALLLSASNGFWFHLVPRNA
ncbi:hypothetical protein pipiens_002300 [Culex pipiens pipiens]|uniref:Cytochrome P450 n=1 Tax=Culex pipiens pipiens TaxID=38569 RepID=A0ABD1DKM7_CULPP